MSEINNQRMVFNHLGSLLWYPEREYHSLVENACVELRAAQPELAEMLETFKSHVASSELCDLEETYTRTFDITPDCALEIGWHLYAESYSRGSFLVEMRERMRSLGLEESAELPDHLAHVCQVLAEMSETDARQFCLDHVVPALSKMREKLPKDRPHASVLAAIEHVVRKMFSIEEEISCGKESLPYFREIETLPPGFDDMQECDDTQGCGAQGCGAQEFEARDFESQDIDKSCGGMP